MTEEEYRTKMRWKQIAYVPQGSFNALNPFIKIVEQISESMANIEMSPEGNVTKRSVDLLNMVGIGKEYSELYPHELSGGMRQRSVIAMALACNPRLLIADEPTTALDVIVQAQIISLLKSLMEKLTLSLILISHDISLVTMICEEIVVMYAGTIVERQDSKDFVRNPLHPYSRLLLNAIPKMKGKKRRLRSIPGSPPDLRNPPSGCRFHPRCSYSRKKCEKDKPLLRTVKHYGNVACHYPLIE
jgi:peptide/nickel transport system ATP-binding protein